MATITICLILHRTNAEADYDDLNVVPSETEQGKRSSTFLYLEKIVLFEYMFQLKEIFIIRCKITRSGRQREDSSAR